MLRTNLQKRRGKPKLEVEDIESGPNEHISEKTATKPFFTQNTLIFIGTIIIAIIIVCLILFRSAFRVQISPEVLKEAKEIIRVNKDTIFMDGKKLPYLSSIPPRGIQLEHQHKNLPDILLLTSYEFDTEVFRRLGTYQYLSYSGYRTFGIDLFYDYVREDTQSKEKNNDEEMVLLIHDIIFQLKLKKNIVIICQGSSAVSYGLPLLFAKHRLEFDLEALIFVEPEISYDYPRTQYQNTNKPFLLIKSATDKKKYWYQDIPNAVVASVNIEKNQQFPIQFHSELNQFLKGLSKLAEMRKNLVTPRNVRMNKKNLGVGLNQGPLKMPPFRTAGREEMIKEEIKKANDAQLLENGLREQYERHRKDDIEIKSNQEIHAKPKLNRQNARFNDEKMMDRGDLRDNFKPPKPNSM